MSRSTWRWQPNPPAQRLDGGELGQAVYLATAIATGTVAVVLPLGEMTEIRFAPGWPTEAGSKATLARVGKTFRQSG